MSAGIRIQYARCEPCQFGHHFDPPEAHTWIGREDADHKGLTWPLTDEQQASNPCACRCAGGPGGCVEATPQQAAALQEIVEAIDRREADRG